MSGDVNLYEHYGAANLEEQRRYAVNLEDAGSPVAALNIRYLCDEIAALRQQVEEDLIAERDAARGFIDRAQALYQEADALYEQMREERDAARQQVEDLTAALREITHIYGDINTSARPRAEEMNAVARRALASESETNPA